MWTLLPTPTQEEAQVVVFSPFNSSTKPTIPYPTSNFFSSFFLSSIFLEFTKRITHKIRQRQWWYGIKKGEKMGCILGKKNWEEYFIYGSQGDVVEMFPFFFSLGDMFMKHSRIFLSKINDMKQEMLWYFSLSGMQRIVNRQQVLAYKWCKARHGRAPFLLFVVIRLS